MESEPQTREAMRWLLAPLSPTWVAAQVGVTRQQVDRWKNGYNVTPARLDQVARAVAALLPASTQPDAPPPPWAHALMTRDEVLELVEGVESRVLEAIRAAATAEDLVDRYVDRTVAELRSAAPQLFAEAAPDPVP